MNRVVNGELSSLISTFQIQQKVLCVIFTFACILLCHCCRCILKHSKTRPDTIASSLLCPTIFLVKKLFIVKWRSICFRCPCTSHSFMHTGNLRVCHYRCSTDEVEFLYVHRTFVQIVDISLIWLVRNRHLLAV